ncbi:hypothetical protein JYT44_00370 [Caldithrix abyssi]|nr:hypothetical protein [Caldithrix abyssi]
MDYTESITEIGTTAAQFLKIGVHTRASTMGNAFTAMNGDISPLSWNSAGSSSFRQMETKLYEQWRARN